VVASSPASFVTWQPHKQHRQTSSQANNKANISREHAHSIGAFSRRRAEPRGLCGRAPGCLPALAAPRRAASGSLHGTTTNNTRT
jgi:hypothetical protein